MDVNNVIQNLILDSCIKLGIYKIFVIFIR